jgi:hypothetical protein
VDSEAHTNCLSLCPNTRIHIHPPKDDRYRAYRKSEYIAEPKPYLERNRDIVMRSDVLVAIPKTDKEDLRSGTWATVRYAQYEQQIPVMIIRPDGNITWRW